MPCLLLHAVAARPDQCGCKAHRATAGVAQMHLVRHARISNRLNSMRRGEEEACSAADLQLVAYGHVGPIAAAAYDFVETFGAEGECTASVCNRDVGVEYAVTELKACDAACTLVCDTCTRRSVSAITR